MDLDEFRSFILDSGIDVWTWIDMAISVASADHENELGNRRDGIIQRLYAPAFSRCQNCDHQFSEGTKCNAKESEEENEKYQQKQDVGFDYNTEGLQSGEKAAAIEEEEEDDDDDDDDDEQGKILEIKILLDDQNQSERSLIDLLQRLVDMDTTFKALKETDIGRHVTRLRKHSSNEVRRLVKILVRKWKDTVDEWVRLNTPMEEATQSNGDKKSPIEAHHDSIHSGVKAQVLHHTDAQKTSVSCYSTPPKGKLKHNQSESDKLGSTTKRLHDQNYQETQHAKKQKTAQVMEFHNIPKLKNAVVTNNGGSVPVKYW
ncbi:hypothetical protein Pfo_021334 [Paulownia fortunei]|nr:hypothetical protein Pfo_021334 [Paulownia fortunei]